MLLRHPCLLNFNQCSLLFSDVPPDVLTFTITVMNRGRRAKDAEVAEVTVDMQALKSGTETEDWYHLTGVTPIGNNYDKYHILE